MDQLDPGDPNFAAKIQETFFKDVFRGCLYGLLQIAWESFVPGFLQRFFFFTAVVGGVVQRRVKNVPLWLEVPLTGLGLRKLFDKHTPSTLILVATTLAGELFRHVRVYRNGAIADKVSFWIGGAMLNAEMLVTGMVMLVFHYSRRMGLVMFLLLPAIGALLATFAREFWAFFLRWPYLLRLPLVGVAFAVDWTNRFLQMRMTPGILRFLDRLEAKSLLAEERRLSKKLRYQYTNIKRQGKFRVLVLERRRLFRLPACRLEVVDLDDPSAHIAISYVWGSNDLTRSIAIGDSRLNITESAFQVIRHQQSFAAPRRIWIDAVCINQDDTDEKADQIPFMSKIFGHALWVDAYLGYGYENTEVWILLSELLNKETMSHIFGSTEESLFEEARLIPHWDTLADVVNSPWFTRAWIVQEAILANNLTLHYGMLKIPWHQFEAVIKAIDTVTIPSLWTTKQAVRTKKLTPSMHEKALLLTLHRTACKRRGSESLYRLLTSFRSHDASDLRDKIYGLLNLTDRHTICAFPIDYHMSIQKLLTRTMRWIIHDQGLHCLVGCGDAEEDLRPVNLPSWIIDWSNPGYSLNKATVPSWHAATEIEHDCSDITYDLDSLGDRLRVKLMPMTDTVGEMIDMIHIDTEIPALKPDENSFLQHKWLSDSLTLVLRNIPIEQTEARKRAFYRTLTSDFQDPDEEEALHWDNADFKSDYELFEAWFNVGGDFNESIPARMSQMMRACYDRYCEENPSHAGMSYLEAIFSGLPIIKPDDPVTRFLTPEHQRKQQRVMRIMFRLRLAGGRKMGITAHGRIASFPKYARPGDEICLIAGAPAPFVVRKAQPDSIDGIETRSIVGWCYLHGGMDGSLATGPWKPCYLL